VEGEGFNGEEGFFVTGSLNWSFLPRIPWSGLIDKYGVNSGRNPEWDSEGEKHLDTRFRGYDKLERVALDLVHVYFAHISPNSRLEFR
jgi:hypothetical protein